MMLLWIIPFVFEAFVGIGIFVCLCHSQKSFVLCQKQNSQLNIPITAF